MNPIPSPFRAVVAGCLTSVVLTFAGTAAAEECTGTNPLELVGGCDVRVANEDFRVQLHAPARAALGSAEGIEEALNRAVIFLHGYGVRAPALPGVFYEDGRGGRFEDLHAAGISIVAMAPGNAPTDRVEDDAEAVESALSMLNGYRGPSALPWVVFGHSMGALMARIALSRMEAEGVPHHVALYVSYDSPHSGVHVPQGMQQLKLKLDEWAAMTEEDFIAIDSGWEGVFRLGSIDGMKETLGPESVNGFPDPTSTQAQQMTIQGVALPEAYPAFMALLDETGFPAVRSIAVSNGNTRAIPNTQEVSPGEELFFFTGAKGNSAASVRGTFEVFTDSPGELCFKSHVYYDGFLRNHDGGTKNARTPEEIVLMDSLSGGTLDYAGQMSAAASRARRDFHNPSWRGAENSAIPFVTTGSALALPLGTADADIADLVATGGTPFDEVFAIGDLEAFPANIDHNTLVLPDALLEEIHTLLPCREGIDRIGCVDEEDEEEDDEPGPDGCGEFEQTTFDGQCEPLWPSDENDLLCACSGGALSPAPGLWLLLLGLAARRRRAVAFRLAGGGGIGAE